MTKKIFRGILLVSMLTMLACLVFIIGVQYQLYRESQLEALENEAYLISRTLNDGGDPEEYEDANDRVTIIASDGEVIYDNKAKADKMENHSEREEFREAIKNGSGYAVRNSETLTERTCYYAVKLDDGSVLRVAGNRLSVWMILLNLLQPIAAIAVFTFILALILASYISKRILKPINELQLNNAEISESYEELAPLIKRINSQNKKIGKQIEQLTRSRREFEIISENMNEGLILTDKNGYILTHNRSAEKFLGISSGINGENILTVNRSETFREIFDSIMAGSHCEKTTEHSGKYYDITGNPVFDENGVPHGAVILIIDTTEKEKRERLRREFTANVSHELKTPLTSILGISDMLKNGMVAPDDIKSFSDDINREAGRLIALVDDIIRLSALDESAYDSESETVDLKTAAEDVRESLANVAEKSGITVCVSGNTAEISAGRSLIFEMIYNLCDNAIKYNKPNGRVDIITGVSDGKSFITVKDTGIGIAEEHIDRIFERFYRVDKSRSKQSGGTGLGLSIVKHIAASAGGRISVKSEPGAGTEITVEFEKN